ncbi:MAG: hypothetical protein L0H98_03370 [Lacticaseibacillus paracasei]|nr:hypothetical protein [Lacticaseibacillus paracasei]MDN6222469.1 hypothetical protein [Lacticaseibacillus paracasei]MDN6334148.1 hypothetical protein [Lacticaseibacillus paracasei]
MLVAPLNAFTGQKPAYKTSSSTGLRSCDRLFATHFTLIFMNDHESCLAYQLKKADQQAVLSTGLTLFV